MPYQGTIQELMGVGLLVFFGALIWREDDAQRAVACAVAMQLAMVTVNEQNRREGLPYDEQQAGICFSEVFAIARRQQAKLLELRAAIGLSPLWQHQGKQEETRELLARIYS